MSVDIAQIEEILFEFEDLMMQKSVLVGIAPSSMAGVQLLAEYYDDEGNQHLKITVLIELTGSRTIDEDTREVIADTTSDWLRDNGLHERLELIGLDPEVMNYFAVDVVHV
ncbi:MAG: hypothetical protein MK089_09310 [Phycisphaerales bacterium]|nr:hypothetical protein [Phycisphaerales bacterium]